MFHTAISNSSYINLDMAQRIVASTTSSAASRNASESTFVRTVRSPSEVGSLGTDLLEMGGGIIVGY